MKRYMQITNIQGREILDSRGNPTVEAQVRSRVPMFITQRTPERGSCFSRSQARSLSKALSS